MAQAITQTTGLDGCTTWSDLDPGVTYGLVEQLPEGWKALIPTSHQFDPAASGAAYSYTFINTRADVGFSVYLPLMIK